VFAFAFDLQYLGASTPRAPHIEGESHIEGEFIVVNRFRDGHKLRVTTQKIQAIELAFGTIEAVCETLKPPKQLLVSH
jgi:hypothetical protein